MKLPPHTHRYAHLSILTAALTLAAASNSAMAQGGAPETDLMAKRIAQATEIKASADQYVAQAKSFHIKAQQLINESDRLTGQATLLAQEWQNQSEAGSSKTLQGSAKYSQGIHFSGPPPLKLSAAQYQAAVGQYSSDVSKFAEHAQQYDAHLQKFNAEIGACHSADQAYAANLKKYEMHLQEFHVPNLRLPSVALATGAIKPPHICPRMMLSQGEAMHVTGTYLNDQLRVLEAQQKLQSAEQRLRDNDVAMGAANLKLETEIKRGQGERDLAVEFGKLREEYDLLKTEKERIATANKLPSPTSAKSTAIVTKVQGKLQK